MLAHRPPITKIRVDSAISRVTRKVFEYVSIPFKKLVHSNVDGLREGFWRGPPPAVPPPRIELP